MIEITVVVATIIVIAISLLLYRSAAGEISPWRINMLSYSLYLLGTHALLVSVLAVLDVQFWFFDPIVYGALIGDQAQRLKVWGIVMWMFLGLPLGAIIANAVLGGRSMSQLIKKYRAASPEIGFGLTEGSLFLTLTTVGSILTAVTVARIFALGEIPILNIFATHNVVDTQFLRTQSRLGSGAVSDIVGTVFSYGTVHWMSYNAYIGGVITRRPKWWILFGVLFVTSLGLVTYNTTITPTLIYFAGFIIIRSLLGQKLLRLHEFVLGSLLIMEMFVVFKGVEGRAVDVMMTNVSGRLTIGQMLGLYRVIEVFPQHVDFIGFASTGKMIHEVFGLPTSPSYGIVAMSYYNPHGVDAGTAGHMTTIFMGEAWANFGFTGILIAPLWVGGVVQAVNVAFLSRRKSAVAVALYAYLTIVFGYSSDFQSFYYPVGLVLFLIGVGITLQVAKIITGKLPGVVGNTTNRPPSSPRQR